MFSTNKTKKLTSIMKHKLILLFGLFISLNINAQTNIKLISYNLLGYPTTTGTDRKDELRFILNTYQPDIFMVVEIESQAGADEILNYCLGTQNYESATFSINHSGSYPLQQMLYYNKHKFELVAENYLMAYVRDINHYTLRLRTPQGSTPVYLEVYVAHLKSSGGVTNENIRYDMVEVFTDDLANIPQDRFVIFAGDFNLYYSNEPAYQEIIDPTNDIVLVDPLNRPGYWHNNSSFKDIFTQSTHSVSENSFVGGGIDDRFDFIMMSENLINSPVLHYIPETYKAYGNNGTCFNKAINSSDCDGSEFDFTLRNYLFNMSDHLPVVAELETPITLSIQENFVSNKYKLNGGNLVHNTLSISSNEQAVLHLKIFNTTGQEVLYLPNYKAGASISISNFDTGIYFLQINDNNNQQIIKFVKTD